MGAGRTPPVHAVLGQLGATADEILDLTAGLGLRPSGVKVVDFTACTGRVPLLLAHRGGMQSFGVCGTEASARFAMKVAERVRLSSSCRFEHGSALQSPCGEEKFDLAIFSWSRGVLELPAGSGPAALEPVVRSLMAAVRPGGYLVLDVPFAADDTVSTYFAAGHDRAPVPSGPRDATPSHLTHSELAEILRDDGRELVLEYIRPRELALESHFRVNHCLDRMSDRAEIDAETCAAVRRSALILDDSLLNGVWILRQS